jgi:hypothetical protein
MENSIKMLTIGAVMITGLIVGGLYAMIIEALIVLIYMILKKI